MPATAIARLESLLRAQKMDRATFQLLDQKPNDLAEIGQPAFDELLAGCFVRGHLFEIVGARSSDRTSLLASVLAAATARGEVVALVDTCDRFDPESGAAAGIKLSSLLWVRGRGGKLSRDLLQAIQQAIKAVGLILDAGGFGVVALDLTDLPSWAIRQIQMTTWMRLSRLLKHSKTVGVLLGSEPVARSAEGQTVVLRARSVAGKWSGTHDRNRLIQGLECQTRVIRVRRPRDESIILQPVFLSSDHYDPSHQKNVRNGVSR
jgi:recombination protein RecA